MARDHHGPYLQEVKVVLGQGQLGESGAPPPQLPDLLLQLLQETLGLVLGCSPVHLDHLGRERCGLIVSNTTQHGDTRGGRQTLVDFTSRMSAW